MALITCRNIHLRFGQPLLDGISFSLDKGERVCLVGRNGTGKSTLLKLLSGDLTPDDGEIVVAEGVRIARLDQEVPLDATGAVFDVVAAGLGDIGNLIRRFHEVSQRVAACPDAATLAELERCQHALDTTDG